LLFRVELWDHGWRRRLETLATAGDFLTAKAAFMAGGETATRRAVIPL
jgi:hypothetical protein